MDQDHFLEPRASFLRPASGEHVFVSCAAHLAAGGATRPAENPTSAGSLLAAQIADLDNNAIQHTERGAGWLAWRRSFVALPPPSRLACWLPFAGPFKSCSLGTWHCRVVAAAAVATAAAAAAPAARLEPEPANNEHSNCKWVDVINNHHRSGSLAGGGRSAVGGHNGSSVGQSRPSAVQGGPQLAGWLAAARPD